jgi:ferrous iron transport protein B
MELPSYKLPSPRLVLHRMFVQGWGFVRRAGTIILAVSVIVWAASYFPHDRAAVEGPYQARLSQWQGDPEKADDLAALRSKIAGDYKRGSYLGRAGKFIEPAVRPLGWDWRIGCAAIAAFPARELVVATLGVLFDVGESPDDEESQSRLRTVLKSATWPGTGRPLFNIPVAFSLMVFFALCAQCFATLAVIKRETNSWRWPVFTFTYMTVLAYLAALATYQVGMLFAV